MINQLAWENINKVEDLISLGITREDVNWVEMYYRSDIKETKYPIGYAAIIMDGDTPIIRCFVDPEHRNKRVFSHVYSKLMQRISAHRKFSKIFYVVAGTIENYHIKILKDRGFKKVNSHMWCKSIRKYYNEPKLYVKYPDKKVFYSIKDVK